MSKKTTRKTTKSTKAAATSEPSANDKARADALPKLNARPDKMATNAPTRGTKPAPATTPAPRITTSPRAKPIRATESTTPAKPKRLSSLDAAARVLGTLHAREARTGLTATELIERMATAGLWTSPGGKTPAATLYAAMTREIAAKGTASRFARADASADGSRGRFVATTHTARRAKA
ncbi:MAG: winged helix-turn-helix domain-containing protein [Phycisphaeraceae bacterium]|nr:winged helix-turn-helix domain-containing protein [Phycisphaeraceae bacterium]